MDVDLWNEHFARYAFASRLSRHKRVLDVGCGTAYGAAELARAAASVVGLDISGEAVGYARTHYSLPNLCFLQGSCTAIPVRPGAFDLVVAFEVIEHVKDWTECLLEIRRVLAPAGQAIISTPNSRYYSASRGATGPNPYHEHEFTFEEFSGALKQVFPYVSLFLQNHIEGFVFQPVMTFSAAEARVESGGGGPDESHFFVAVCALAPQTGAPTYVYLPRAANILRERELHIERLSQELATKNNWIAQLTEERQKLLDLLRKQKEELEERNRWAEELNGQLEEAGARIRKLQDELQAATRWAQETDRRLAECVNLFEEAEKTVKERTEWALKLQQQVDGLEAELNRIRASRWVRLGRAFGVGPEVRGA